MKCGGSVCPGWEELEVAGRAGGNFCIWFEVEAADAVAALIRLPLCSLANLGWLQLGFP